MPISSKRYKEECNKEAVKQITDRGYSVVDVAQRLGNTTYSLYAWLKKYGEPSPQQANHQDLATENMRLKAELRRMIEERDISKKAAKYFASQSE